MPTGIEESKITFQYKFTNNPDMQNVSTNQLLIIYIFCREEGDTALHLIAALTSSSCDEETMNQMAEIADTMIQKSADINRQNRKGL